MAGEPPTTLFFVEVTDAPENVYYRLGRESGKYTMEHHARNKQRQLADQGIRSRILVANIPWEVLEYELD